MNQHKCPRPVTRAATAWFAAICMGLLILFTTSADSALASSDERAALRERFKERFPTLVQLKRTGKIGETSQGLVEAVESGHLNQPAQAGQEQTIREFLDLENRDRRRLYELMAVELETTPQVVAERNARRHFDNAQPDEFLKPPSGQWVRKRDMQ